MLVLHKKFKEELLNKINDQSSFVCDGHAYDMQEYGRRCGYLMALKDSLNIFEELAEKYKED